MTEEEIKEMFEKIQGQIKILEGFKKSLESFTTIPFNVDKAWRERFKDIVGLKVSTKDLDSEDQAVNEGGAGTYDVLGDPDGFLEFTVQGTTYYIPYY